MIAAAKRADIAARLLTEKEALNYTRMGRTAFRKWADIIGAKRKIGRSARYDREVIDRAIDDMGNGSGKQCEE